MDLERIKQNLRLRSGRTKKNKKPALQHSQSKLQANGFAAPASKPVDFAPTPIKKENSSLVGSKDVTPGRPGSEGARVSQNGFPEEHLDTAQNVQGVNGSASEHSDRFGRSTIERPERTSPPTNSDPVEPSSEEPSGEEKSREETRPGEPGSVEGSREGLSPEEPGTAADEPVMADPKSASPDETDTNDYDLRPPPRKEKPPSLENLAELLFSEGHLNTIVHDPQLLLRLNSFLSRYKSDLAPLLIRYLETQKALKAVEYANAVADSMSTMSSDDVDGAETRNPPKSAAQMNPEFEESSRTVFSSLLSEGLPAYITYQLVKIVTDCLVNEITGRSIPMMRNLVGGLSEIFCLTDPTEEDNPIIYASEEFYRLSGYDTTDVIGSNCRFLQGRKTEKESVKRLRKAQDKGEQHCETLLNYRRDGRPFINLLMIAPLFDDKNKLKYYIGAQIDVSGLVEGGRSLKGFEKFLSKRARDTGQRRSNRDETELEVKKRKALEKLKELSEMFDLEESAVVQSHSRSSSMIRGDDESINSKGRIRTGRRVLADSSRSSDEDESENETDNEDDKAAWKLAQTGTSGKLPGLYESYLLVRPAPLLRIVFVSPALRKMGNIMQSPFMAHVAASGSTLSGLKDSFKIGVPVTAKIGFMPKAGKWRDGIEVDRASGKRGATKEEEEAVKSAKACYMSATPMLGGDDQVGVWMVVIVQKPRGNSRMPSKVRNSDSAENTPQRPGRDSTPQPRMSRSKAREGDMPIKPRRLEDVANGTSQSVASPTPDPNTKGAESTEQLNEEEYEGVPKSDQFEDDKDHDNDDNAFVLRRESKSRPRSERVHIQPDSDDEADSPIDGDTHDVAPASQDTHEIASSPSNNFGGNGHSDQNEGTITNPSPPPENTNEISGESLEGGPQDDDDTPTKPTPNHDHGPESNSARRSGMLYMDYLRHPGSGGSKPPNGTSDSDMSDPDCMRSPYSVD